MARNVISRCIPGANPEHYEILWFGDVPAEHENGTVGFIRNGDNPAIRIDIIVSDSFLAQMNLRAVYLATDVSSPEAYLSNSMIVISEALYQGLLQIDALEAVLWQQIGYFHLAHYFKPSDVRKDGKMIAGEERSEDEDKAADLFAVCALDIDRWTTGWNWLIRDRESGVSGFFENYNPVLSKMRARRTYIRGLDGKEAAERALRRLTADKPFSEL